MTFQYIHGLYESINIVKDLVSYHAGELFNHNNSSFDNHIFVLLVKFKLSDYVNQSWFVFIYDTLYDCKSYGHDIRTTLVW